MSNAAERGNWDEDFKEDAGKDASKKSSNGNGKALYMDMSKPGNYKVRLVGPHIKCRKHFIPYKATVGDNDKENDPAWKAGFIPSKRFAINVIDKTGLKAGEVGQLKILEKGPGVFKAFYNYKAVFGVDPSGKEGPDFNVTVKVPDPKDKKSTEYTVMHIEKAPFTEAEAEMIKSHKLWPLPDIYKSTSAEKLKEMWDALPDAKKIAPAPKKRDDYGKGNPSESSAENTGSAATKVEEKIEEKMEDSPANDDNEVFGEESADKKTSGTDLW